MLYLVVLQVKRSTIGFYKEILSIFGDFSNFLIRTIKRILTTMAHLNIRSFLVMPVAHWIPPSSKLDSDWSKAFSFIVQYAVFENQTKVLRICTWYETEL